MRKLYEKLMDEARDKMEQFTHEQFEKCVTEAIKCGDFMQYIQQSLNSDMKVEFTYIPFREMAILKMRIRKLEEVLDWYSNGNGVDWMEINYDIYTTQEEE